MSDTPLTLPPGTQDPNSSGMDKTVSSSGQGITIWEPENIIRLASPPRPDVSNGKGKLVQHVGDSDSDGDDDAIVPCVSPIQQTVGETSRPVQCQLFPPQPDGRNAARIQTATAGGDAENVGQDLPYAEEIVWSRFQQALHKMLSEANADPTFFCRDAPHVFNDNGIDGKVLL